MPGNTMKFTIDKWPKDLMEGIDFRAKGQGKSRRTLLIEVLTPIFEKDVQAVKHARQSAKEG